MCRPEVIPKVETRFIPAQIVRQGRVLALLPFDILFAVIINVTSTRFKADKGIMDALVHLRKKKGGGGPEGSNYLRVSPSNAALGHALC